MDKVQVMSNSCSAVDGVQGQLAASELPVRLSTLCGRCNKEIPQARLKAVSDATHCVDCTRQLGDVPLIKRYDEPKGEETVSTYYQVPNQYLRLMLNREYGEDSIPESFDEQDFKDGFRSRPIYTA